MQHRLGVTPHLFAQVRAGAAHHHHDDVFAHVAHQLRQLHLAFRQAHGLAVAPVGEGVVKAQFLALDIAVKAQAQHGHIRLGRGRHPLALQVLEAVPVAALKDGAAVGDQDLRVGKFPADTVRHGDVFRRVAVVVALQHRAGHGVGPHHGDGAFLCFIQRQKAVFVFQQHDGLLRRPQVQRFGLLAAQHGVGDIRVGAVFLKLAQQRPDGEQPFRRGGQVRVVDQVLLVGLQQMGVGVAAVQLAPRL